MKDLAKAARKVEEGTLIEDKDPFSCTFCGRTRIEAGEIYGERKAVISGPKVFICIGCTRAINAQIAIVEGAAKIPEAPPMPETCLQILSRSMASPCSFCGKPRSPDEHPTHLFGTPKVRICDECIALCMDIFEEDREDQESKGT